MLSKTINRKNRSIPDKIGNKMSRKEKIFFLIHKTGKGLEIGPSHNPLAPKRDGFNVEILDHADANQLRIKYKGQEDYGVNIENIEEVDFVWQGEPITELIGKTGCYDWIISSHVIEHIPDIISHLQQCEAILKPDGILSMAIPDKRYCFDYFSDVSSTGNLIDSYMEKRIRPSHGQVFDHFANAVKRRGEITWSDDGKGGGDEFIYTFSQAKELLDRSFSSAEYIDAHCWRFTPASFRLIITDLLQLGMIGLEIRKEFVTTGCEFYVSLGKVSDGQLKKDRKELLQEIKEEQQKMVKQ